MDEKLLRLRTQLVAKLRRLHSDRLERLDEMDFRNADIILARITELRGVVDKIDELIEGGGANGHANA